jgi:hypothetical protein
MRKNHLCLLAFCLALLVTVPGLAQTSAPPDLDAYVARVLKEFEVPGLAIAMADAIHSFPADLEDSTNWNRG